MSKIIKNNSNPTNIEFLTDLINDSYGLFGLDNTFCIFTSINKILYLIYTDIEYSIICFDLIYNKKIMELKKAHEEDITNFRHIFDRINLTDLILSISFLDNNLKVWNFKNFECLVNIKKVNNLGNLRSACFLFYNNQNYILTSNSNSKDNANMEPIKVFDLRGIKINEINESNDDTIFIDVYYDKKFLKNYIITGNNCYIKSYDYKENKIYHKYDDNNYYDHTCVIINDFKEIIKMIETSGDGFIRIWDFHSALLQCKIKISEGYLYSMCLWNNEYIFVGCRDKTIKLIELKSGNIIKKLEGHNKDVITIKKIFLPKYGECLLSLGKYDAQIKLWINKN